MAVTVKKITLWRADVQNKPGVLGDVLGALAGAGTDLQVVMGYRLGNQGKAAIEACPVSGQKSIRAAKAAGLSAASTATLLVEGDDRPGLGHAIAAAMGEAGLNIEFLVAQVVGTKFSAVIGFENVEASRKAAALIKKVARAADK